MLLAHGAFKAAAFMVVGIVDHQHGTRDLRRLPRPGAGLAGRARRRRRAAAASMAGVPLLFGFIAKEADFDGFVDQGTGGAGALAGLVARLGPHRRLQPPLPRRRRRPPRRRRRRRPRAPGRPRAAGAAFVAPAAVLAAATRRARRRPRASSTGSSAPPPTSLDGAVGEVHLALWHGFNIELLLSAVALAGGVVLFVGRRPVGRGAGARARRARRRPAATSARCAALNAVANRVTAVAQPGSLPVYLGVILLTAALVPGALLLSGPWWPGWPRARRGAGRTCRSPPCSSALALAAAIVRRRFSGALFLGMVGYSMAGLFVVQGAPDLALTQVAIETLSTVLFVLVLRRLPDRFETTPGAARRARAHRHRRPSSAGSCSCSRWPSAAIDPPTTSSDAMIEQAYPEGDGRNVVNVILVDIRGFDTLGEITVLTAAAIGTVALARAGAADPGARRVDADGDPRAPTAAGAAHPPGHDRGVGAHRVRRRDARLAVAAVRRPQPAGRRLRRRHRRRRRGLAALRRRRARRGPPPLARQAVDGPRRRPADLGRRRRSCRCCSAARCCRPARTRSTCRCSAR